MTASISCPSCGTPTEASDRFCGGCGADLAALREAPLARAPAAAAEPPRKPLQKTMLGMMSPMLEPAAAAAASAPVAAPLAAAPQAPAPAASAAPNPKKTMLGMMPLNMPAPAGPVVVEPGKAPGTPLTPHGANGGRPGEARQTVFGLGEKDAAPATAAAAAPAAGKLPGGANRTILGVAPVVAPVPAAEPAPAQPHKPALSPQTNQTMLGAAPPAAFAHGPQAAAPRGFERKFADDAPLSFTPVPDQTEAPYNAWADAPQASPQAGQGGGSRLPLILAGLGLAFALIAAVIWFVGRPPELSVRVVRTDAGDALEVEVPKSKPGTKLRFAGAERPLNAGRATFPLSAESLALGENELAIGVVAPDGDIASTKVQLMVDYRVRTDLGALSRDPPAVEVVVDALPGSKVSLDGAPMALDARGHGVKAYPVPPQASARFDLNARYRVELPEAAAVDGTVELSLPVTSMQIDRPGSDVITDQSLIEVAGAVEPGAQVTVEGHAIDVKDGRFLHRAELPQAGDYVLHVTARAPGKAPRLSELHLRRVADMTLAAASFKADPALTYARIAANPVIYRGQRVAFDGRVYNVEVQGGRSVLQMLALDCPSSTRCPLWIEYPQATEATVDSWVRVLGLIAGEQQFRSKQGAVQTVPSVQAQYVLKLAR